MSFLTMRQFKCLYCEKLVHVYANLCTCNVIANNKAPNIIFIQINKLNAVICKAQICMCHTN